MPKIVLCLILIFITGIINAQLDIPFDKNNIKPKETYNVVMDSMNKGDKNFGLGHYKQALLDYRYPQEINPDNSDLNFKIGICYLNGAHKDLARPYFEKAYNLEKKVNSNIYYFMGRSYQFEGNWEEAKKHFNLYTKSKYSSQKEIHIKQCDRAIELSKNLVKVEIVNVGDSVNTIHYEYSALISADHSVMYYTGRYPTTTGNSFDNDLNDWKEDVYKSEFSDGEWSKGINLGESVNTSSHDAVVGLSSDAKTLFLYKAVKNNGGDLYVCKAEGNGWTTPIPLNDKINTKHHETSVSLSADEKTLYYVSSKPGGEGGSDIYTAQLNENGNWDNVKNIGNTINSDQDEESVFIHPDGQTIYFSSKGHNTIGGFDVFYSTIKDGEWSTPINIGIPINTADDDVFFVIDASGENGYYTSGKIGGKGETDIYLLEFETEKVIATLKGTTSDAKGNVIGTEILIYDEETNQLVNTINSNSATGEYIITLDNNKKFRFELNHNEYENIKEFIEIPYAEENQEIIRDFQFKESEVVDISDTTILNEEIKPKPIYEYSLQYFATIELIKANKIKSQISKLGVPGVYIQKVIFTDINEINYRVRSGRYNSIEEAQLDGDKIDQSGLPEKGFWIDNVRKEDYSVKKLEYDILVPEFIEEISFIFIPASFAHNICRL